MKFKKPRLVVAADYDPEKCGGIPGVIRNVRTLAQSLMDLDVDIKANSYARAAGHRELAGLRNLMGDYKLTDISETLRIDGAFIADSVGIFSSITVMCSANTQAIRALCDAVQPAGIRVVGVTVPTSWSPADCQAVYGSPVVADVVERLALIGAAGGLDAIVASGLELERLCAHSQLSHLGREIPGIRPEWSFTPNDDQKRVVTPTQAVVRGATAIIVGRPITTAKPNSEGRPQSPREAVEWILKEIDDAYAILQ